MNAAYNIGPHNLLGTLFQVCFFFLALSKTGTHLALNTKIVHKLFNFLIKLIFRIIHMNIWVRDMLFTS